MNKRETGDKYETLAAEVLQNNGYRILERNFRCREGEIDLIALEDGYLVFVEVKYRKDCKKGTAAAAVDIKKQKKICRVADYYLFKNRLYADASVRFDVAAIDGTEVHIIKNAFSYIGNVRF